MVGRISRVAGSLSLVAFLAACGGGGGGGGVAQNVTGRVIDGYISNATVCLDLNNNFVCDAGEPRAVTSSEPGREGEFSISYTGSLDGVRILAVVDTNAVDSDLGPITQPYNLLAPAESAETVTPLSTLVAKEMLVTGASKEAAVDAIKTSLNLRAEPLNYDFKKASDAATLQVAQTIAAAIAVTTQAITQNPTARASLSDGQIIQAAISQVKDVIAPALIRSDGTVANSCAASCSQADIISSVNTQVSVATVISGRIENIVQETKSGVGSVASFAEAVKAGMVIVQKDTGDYLDADGKRVNGKWNGYEDEIYAEYIVGSSPTSIKSLERVFVPEKNGWFKIFDRRERITYLDPKTGKWGEFDQDQDGLDETVIPDGNCVTIQERQGSFKACIVEKNLAGVKLGEVVKDICKNNELAISGCNENTTFPAGSVGYNVTFSQETDLYEFWADEYVSWPGPGGRPEDYDEGWRGYCYTSGCVQDNVSPSLAGFIEETKSFEQFTGNGCNTPFKIAGNINSGKFLWGKKKAGGCSGGYTFEEAEQTDYKVSKLDGRDVMFVNIPNVYRANNPDDVRLGCQFMFAVVNQLKDGAPSPGVFKGEYCPKSSRTTLNFTGNIDASPQFLSKIAFDTILSARKMAPFPYAELK